MISGAAEGKGLGHKFLRHVSKTKMILHLISLEDENPINQYYTIREELSKHGQGLSDKEEWIVLTKKDLVNKEYIDDTIKKLEKIEKRVLVVGKNDPKSYKEVSDELINHLRKGIG